MTEKESLNHSKWYCKYHVVWIPKYRKKKLYAGLRSDLGEALHELARQKECRIEEGHLLEDHVHMLISIPPKYAVSSVIGFIKGKSAIYIARNFSGRRKNFTGETIITAPAELPKIVRIDCNKDITFLPLVHVYE